MNKNIIMNKRAEHLCLAYKRIGTFIIRREKE